MTDELPTPRARTAMAATLTQNAANRTQDNLENVIARFMFPTPIARDYRGARLPETLKAKGRGFWNSLPDALSECGIRGALNPCFIEAMMGYPRGHTELKPSETPSSRKSLRSSAKR
jgi:hypothetical protein